MSGRSPACTLPRATVHQLHALAPDADHRAERRGYSRSEPRGVRPRLFALLIRLGRNTLRRSVSRIQQTHISPIHHTTDPRQASRKQSPPPNHSTDSTRVSEVQGSSAQDIYEVRPATCDRVRTVTRIEQPRRIHKERLRWLELDCSHHLQTVSDGVQSRVQSRCAPSVRGSFLL